MQQSGKKPKVTKRGNIMEDKRLPVSDRLDFVNNLLDKINSDGRESTSKEKIHINNPLTK